AHNIAMSTLPNFTLPGDVSASQRYWNEDIIEPEVEVTSQGTIRVPTRPGIGYAVRRELVVRLTVRKKEWTAATLDTRIHAIMSRPEYAHSTFGIEFLSLDSGKLVYQWNADKLMVPGSTT